MSLHLLAISHAMSRDGSSGGVIRLVIIDKYGVEKEVVLGIIIYYTIYFIQRILISQILRAHILQRVKTCDN